MSPCIITKHEHDLLSYLIIFPVNEGQLEPVLGWINSEDPGLTLSVQTVDAAALHHGDIDGQVQGADNTMVTARDNN